MEGNGGFQRNYMNIREFCRQLEIYANDLEKTSQAFEKSLQEVEWRSGEDRMIRYLLDGYYEWLDFIEKEIIATNSAIETLNTAANMQESGLHEGWKVITG